VKWIITTFVIFSAVVVTAVVTISDPVEMPATNNDISSKESVDFTCRYTRLAHLRLSKIHWTMVRMGLSEASIKAFIMSYEKLSKKVCSSPKMAFSQMREVEGIEDAFNSLAEEFAELLSISIEQATELLQGAIDKELSIYKDICDASSEDSLLDDAVTFNQALSEESASTCKSPDTDPSGSPLSGSQNKPFALRSCIDTAVENAIENSQCGPLGKPSPDGSGGTNTSTSASTGTSTTASCGEGCTVTTTVKSCGDNCSVTTIVTEKSGSTNTAKTTVSTDEYGNVTTIAERESLTKDQYGRPKYTGSITVSVIDSQGQSVGDPLTISINGKDISINGVSQKTADARAIDETIRVIDGYIADLTTDPSVAADVIKSLGGQGWIVQIDEKLLLLGLFRLKIELVQQKGNLRCVGFQATPSTFMTYLLPSPGGGGSSGTPNISEAVNSCICQNGGFASTPGGACPEEVERTKRMECLHSPWGPDDKPKPECIELLKKDNRILHTEYNLCPQVQCPGDSVNMYGNFFIYGNLFNPIPKGNPITGGNPQGCGCMKSAIGEIAIPGQNLCEVITCGADSRCVCQGLNACGCTISNIESKIMTNTFNNPLVPALPFDPANINNPN